MSLVMLCQAWRARISVQSSRRPPAIDEDGVTRDERGCRRTQEDDCAGHLHRLADTMQCRDALDGVGTERRVRQRLLSAGCEDKRGRHGVYRNVVLAPLDRETLCKV